MKIRRLDDAQPDSSLSNLAELRLAQIQKMPNKSEVFEKLKREMLSIAQQGKGVDYNSIPPPLFQSGLECQTYALLNGARAVKSGIDTTIPEQGFKIVQKVRAATSSAGHQNMSMMDVALHFSEVGIPLRELVSSDNPIQLVRNLFVSNRFLGVSDSQTWHATSIVPLNNPSESSFVVRLDSLGGNMKILSLTEFLQMLMSKDSFKDAHYIYDVGDHR